MISQEKERQARAAARTLDINQLSNYLPHILPGRAQSIVDLIWSRASDRQNIQVLNKLEELSKTNSIWSPKSLTHLLQPAISLNRPHSVSWLLDRVPQDEVQAAVVVSISAKYIPQDMTESMLEVAARYPNLMSGAQVPHHRLSLLNFAIQSRDVEATSKLVDFMRPVGLSSFQDESIVASAPALMWERWSEKASFEDIEYWHNVVQSPTHPLHKDFPLSWTSPTLFHSALLQNNDCTPQIICQPTGSTAAQAVKDVFSGSLGILVMIAWIYNKPAVVASMLKSSKEFASLMLSLKDAEGNNFIHTLCRGRCVPEGAINPQNLSWSRLEKWVLENAPDLLKQPNLAGDTPLNHIAIHHPKWYSSIVRVLLRGIPQKETPAKTSHGKSTAPRM